MKAREYKPREKTLLILLFVVTVATVYGVFPLRRHLRAIGNAEGRAEFVRAEMEGIKMPEGLIPDTDRIAADLAGVRKQREALEARLARQGGGLLSGRGPERFEELNHRISSLARESGVLVKVNVPLSEYEVLDFVRRHHLEGDPEPDASRPLIPGDPRDRPFRRLNLEASFTGFRRFIQGFTALSPRIVVVGFDLGTDRRGGPTFGPPWIQVELTWVLL